MTISLIITCTLVFLYSVNLPPVAVKRLFSTYGLVPARILTLDFTRGIPFISFFSSMFLHGNWGHLLSNMWALWLFGDNIEDLMGSFRFLLFYFVGGVAAGLVHVLTNPFETAPAIGASGAVAGVMGAYFLLYPTARIITLVPVFFFPLFIHIPAFFYLGGWFLLQLIQGTAAFLGVGSAGGIAWWAHVGGFVAGILVVRRFLLRPRRYYRNW
jgi:membrane associated rhomboid family serine protease